MIRLDKYLCSVGLGSRENAKKLIRNGRITVEGQSFLKAETKIDENAAVFLDGERLQYRKFVYLVFHKPAGVLTAKSDAREKTVFDFIEPKVPDLSPVGRLDKDTEGLLLFTNDGALAHRLLSPKSEIPKTYYLRTDTPIAPDAAEKLLQPIKFSDFTSKPAVLQVLSGNEAKITVTEGRFHEVKRLLHAVGSDVTYLKRIAFGPLLLGDLPLGACREVTEEELEALRGIKGETA